MASQLTTKHCVPCAGGTPPLKGQAIRDLLGQLNSDWQVVDEHHLEKTFKFKDFRQALEFVNRVGTIAEEEGHHPDFFLTWGKVGLTVMTHKVDGLTENDFILAAKADQVKESMSPQEVHA